MSNAPQTAPVAPVVLEARHDGIVTLMMNRPDRLNALNNELVSALNDAFSRVAQDEAVRVVILTGAGRAFCAGGDLGGRRRVHNNGGVKHLEPLRRSGGQTG